MTELAPPAAAVPRRAIQIAKMLAYFVLLIVGVRILEEILRDISRTQYADELSRVSGMAASILDVNKNLDDLIVTLLALTITLLLILPVSWVHVITKGDESDPSLTQTLIVLSVIVAGVMLMLEDNLARAFSLVGVVAAVRYRNTLKDPKDAVYVFLALGIGMACGFQSYHVALVLSLFECAILLVLSVYRAGSPSPGAASADASNGRSPLDVRKAKPANAVLTIEITGRTAFDAVSAIMKADDGQWRLLESEEDDGMTELEYVGRLKKKRTPPLSLLERLRRADAGVRHVGFRSLREPLNGSRNGTESAAHEGKSP